MTDSMRSDGLRTIFSFFLGLILAVFVGVGVYTFHPPPEQFQSEIRELNRRQQNIRDANPSDEPTTQERDEMREINRRRTELVDAEAEARKPWGRRTSIALIACATVVMAVSLVRADQLPVISNGLLLGGVFTMLYGVGWIAVTDTSTTRFLAMTAALVITLGLGYVRFVRRGAGGAAAPSPPEAGALADIERRVRALEERVSDAGSAVGRRRDDTTASSASAPVAGGAP